MVARSVPTDLSRGRRSRPVLPSGCSPPAERLQAFTWRLPHGVGLACLASEDGQGRCRTLRVSSQPESVPVSAPKCCPGSLPSWASFHLRGHCPAAWLTAASLLSQRSYGGHPLMAFAAPLSASRGSRSPGWMTFSVFPLPGFEPPALALGSTRRGVFGPAVFFRPLSRLKPPGAPTTCRYCVRRLRAPRTEVRGCKLPTRASPPAACQLLVAVGSPHGVLPTFGVCAQLESVASPKWARSPLGHSPRLRGSSLPVCPCCLQHGSAHDLWSLEPSSSLQSRVFSVFPPEAVAPCSRRRRAALAFLACLLAPPFGCSARRRPDVRSSDASRPGNSGLPYRGFPARCLPHDLHRGRPLRPFSEPWGFKFSWRPLQPRASAECP